MAVDFYRLFVSIFICQLAGFVSGILNSKSIEAWYVKLRKPIFNPPNWVFSPIWTILFLLQGISLYLVWSSGLTNEDTLFALIMFFFQMILNISWSFLFFGKKSLFLSLGDIVFLIFAIIITMLSFYNISELATYLLMPYLFWVIFVMILNFAIWVLNYTDK